MVLLALLNGFFGTTVENAYTWGGKSQSVFQRSFIKEKDGEEESQQLINYGQYKFKEKTDVGQIFFHHHSDLVKYFHFGLSIT